MKNKTCKWNLNVNVQNKSMFNAPKRMPSLASQLRDLELWRQTDSRETLPTSPRTKHPGLEFTSLGAYL